MELNYSGQEKVQAPPAAVWAFVQDPQRVARCLPSVKDVQVTGPNQLTANAQIGLGLLRGNFRFDIQVLPDESANTVKVLVKGSGMGSGLDMTAGAKVVDDGDGTTTLDWQGAAALQGPLARMGGRMLDGEVQKLIARTFQNMSAAIQDSAGKLA